jgi:hypothetical protein
MKVESVKKFLVLPLLVLFAAGIGCNGVGGQGPESSGQQLPPFTEGKPVVIPANTVIYVQLREAIMSASAHSGQSFAAVLDEPLLVDGQTVAPQGAEVTGKVVSARESGRLHTGGYVRITLSSIIVNGKTMPVQTNTAIAGGGSFRNRDLSFVNGGSGGPLSTSFHAASSASNKKAAGFAEDSRIGFRLMQPLTIS